MGAPRKDEERGKRYAYCAGKALRELSKEHKGEYVILLQLLFDQYPLMKLQNAQSRVYRMIAQMYPWRLQQIRNSLLAEYEPWKSAVAVTGMPKHGPIKVPKPDFDGLALVNMRKDRRNRAQGSSVGAGRD